MHAFRVFATSLLASASLATCHQQQPLIPTSQPLLRNATFDDADGITSVITAAFYPAPTWRYVYQFRDTYPKEHHRCMRQQIMAGLEYDRFHVEVIEAPEEGDLTVAAVAIWYQGAPMENGGLLFSQTMLKECEHRDRNFTRALDMAKKSDTALRKYVEAPFGSDQLYLEILAVHPEYQLHGAGSRLVSRGVEIGRKEGVNVTLVALPTSEGFYAHIGFRSFTNFTISSIDEDEDFRYNVMAYDFNAEK